MIKKLFYRISAAILTAVIIAQTSPLNLRAADFADVPSGHWAYDYVNEMRDLGLTSGIGDNLFGVGRTVTRAEFVTFLCNVMGWQPVSTADGGFADNQDTTAWYYGYIAAAGATVEPSSANFRPSEAITREEMAVMIVRALGYEALAGQIASLGTDFSDVSANAGYISIAKDFGIISGMGDGTFAPNSTATREQAAAMLINLNNLLSNELEFKNGFYAISSYSQIDAVAGLDCTSFGWARLELNDGTVSLNTTKSNGNEYTIPSGYSEAFDAAQGKTRMLMVAVTNSTASGILADENLRTQAAYIMAQATSLSASDGGVIGFDGVVVDFEGLKGKSAKANFNAFLTELDSLLERRGKLMYVAVAPKVSGGREYYDGYDYRTIGALADKVILMAHDYNATYLTEDEMARGVVMTPVAPLGEVYYALREITDSESGVQDVSKVVLQISFDSVQWKLQNGSVINQTPYTPSYDAIAARIAGGAEQKYSEDYASPYLTFYNADDATDNVLWYEDSRSVTAKINLAKMFGVSGISVWRLGIVPDYNYGNMNVLDTILAE